MPQFLYNTHGHTPALAGGARELRVPSRKKAQFACTERRYACDRPGYRLLRYSSVTDTSILIATKEIYRGEPA